MNHLYLEKAIREQIAFLEQELNRIIASKSAGLHEVRAEAEDWMASARSDRRFRQWRDEQLQRQLLEDE